MKKIILKIKDMHCTSCSVLIDTVLEELAGVKSANTDFAKAQTKVEFDAEQATVPQLIAAIKGEGYEAELAE